MTTASFEHEIALTENLLELLKREQASLVKVDVDAMEGLLNDKARVLQDINASTQARYQAITGLGFGPDERGLAAWIAVQDAVIQKSWGRFQSLIDQAKELNRVNGILISKQFRRNQQVLDTLGRPPSLEQFYGPNGQASTGSTRYNAHA
ncbi:MULTISPECIES: flagella synthesis protein FlgN [Methylobacillus]|uniref:FlgN n=1 Tax=Methylobacillus flagellatus (strain ATCC 51484 / DSM 6875 / VKM B-1610 / KT) TaxID=265072 RepID=Q1GZW9_METFK|nr:MULTISPECIES: flagellar protein FlgN [Methylobacillus]ABE50218.1 FlgN [Methylobacillus flagellatus KT]MPS48441.1 flagellar protein FlgN [Methylobacillus sp.]